MLVRILMTVFLSIALLGCGEEKLPENANGKELFVHYCSSCHEKDGGGNFIKGIPANAASEMSASDIMLLIRKGKKDKPGMPVFENMSRKDALLISSYVKEQLR